MKSPLLLAGLLLAGFSCVDFTPKPRGYMRIELAPHQYAALPPDSFPYTFNVSRLAMVELPPAGGPTGWLNLSYPSLGVKIYCSFLTGNKKSLQAAEAESRNLVARQAKRIADVKEKTYTDAGEHIYASLFLLGGESASPLQFMLTDSASRFFRGALFYDTRPNADSLAPVTAYLQEDVTELIQSFRWRN